MRQLTGTKRINPPTEMAMNTEHNQRIQLHEDRQYRDCRPCRCRQDQPD